MLYKKNKIVFILCLILLLMNFSLFCQETDDPDGSYDQVDAADINNEPVYEDTADEDPAVFSQETESTEPGSDLQLTDEEFANLSDEDKIYVYFNFPQLLPENFDPDPYMYLFHPELEDLE